MKHEELSEEAREAQRRYLREWRKRNKEKVAKYNRDYWAHRVEKARQREEAGR